MADSPSPNDSDTSGKWSHDLLLDKAEELRRRLKVWHTVNVVTPQRVVSFHDAQSTIRMTFRDSVLEGNDLSSTVPSGQYFVPLDPDEAGFELEDPPRDSDQPVTLRLLREFLEHLDDAGASAQGDYLRLKFDHILSAPMYCERPPADRGEEWLLVEHNRKRVGEGPFTLIGGLPIDDESLDSLVAAAKALFESATTDNTGQPATDTPTGTKPEETKLKRSTQRGEARVKLISALTKHHKYADGGCLNLEPIGNNELARRTRVAKRTASSFFSREFHGHDKYCVLCNDPHRLVAALKALNDEFRPRDFYDTRTPDEVEREDEVKREDE